ncbi:hypothetical protein [Pedobacter xixiisoli]|uniref:Uncharacterized protein n=1 Tax=Pedobacter xixiisoli TaxID=1476464 RepID=A0A285ZNF1_9SPHI|nr:hypothetical protein [Pedobacter xixiisoli]SOD11173.1 hypothetical protein SAMN06297358_0017 [Pedobacter xixiisoli]
MKKVIGMLILLLSIAFIGILILKVWGINIVSLDSILKSGYTLLLLGALIVVLILVYGAFLKNDGSKYNKQVGNNAHPKL